MASHEELEPPAELRNADPGAHQMADYSDSDDQFTDAQSAPMSSTASSPVPKTRVERVDDEPAYGEVPGTDAAKAREADAKPDEIALAPNSDLEATSSGSSGSLPTTVVEEAPGESPSPNSAEFESKRAADAKPDVVIKTDDQDDDAEDNDALATPTESTVTSSHRRRKSSRAAQLAAPVPQYDEEEDGEENNDGEGDDDFGDDFDDFEEGGEDDDFDDFEEGFQQSQPVPAAVQPLPFTIPDFDGLAPEEVTAATEPYLSSIFSSDDTKLPSLPPLSKESTVFLTPRSASLWSQLVAPPPLAPPDWIRSRTRRLFLVSLGVPVDLDEILPASKQKKLVLPSLNISSASPRTSSDSRSVSRLRHGDGNTSSTSVDTQGKPSKKRRGPPPAPELDLVAARQLCTTTDEALDGMTNEELQAHVQRLESMEGTAKELLEYWQKRTDEKIGDREAFEGVIENLVKHARKVRK